MNPTSDQSGFIGSFDVQYHDLSDLGSLILTQITLKECTLRHIITLYILCLTIFFVIISLNYNDCKCLYNQLIVGLATINVLCAWHNVSTIPEVISQGWLLFLNLYIYMTVCYLFYYKKFTEIRFFTDFHTVL